MKVFLISSLLLLFQFSQTEIRQLFVNASTSETALNNLNSSTQNQKNDFEKSYYAASLMIGAKYEKNNITKLKNFKKGADILDGIIAIHNDNMEYRFIRYSIQKNAPSILRYNAEINEDKALIQKKLPSSQLPQWYKNRIINMIKD